LEDWPKASVPVLPQSPKTTNQSGFFEKDNEGLQSSFFGDRFPRGGPTGPTAVGSGAFDTFVSAPQDGVRDDVERVHVATLAASFAACHPHFGGRAGGFEHDLCARKVATGEALQALALPQSVTILQPRSSWRLPAQSIVRVERRPNEAKPTQYGVQSWSRLSEQLFRVDKWSVCRG
jgi:hypothetical protein